MSQMRDPTPLDTMRSLIEERAVRDALRAEENSVARAAKRLGVHRATVYRLMARYGIEIKRIIA